MLWLSEPYSMTWSKYDKITLSRRGFIENYTIWDHHGERCIEASNWEATNAPKLRENDDAILSWCMMVRGDDVAKGGGGEGCGGEDDCEEDEEEEDFMEEMLRHVEAE